MRLLELVQVLHFRIEELEPDVFLSVAPRCFRKESERVLVVHEPELVAGAARDDRVVGDVGRRAGRWRASTRGSAGAIVAVAAP